MQQQIPAASERAEEYSPVLAQIFWIALFSAVTALAARAEIPHRPVPYTLQTLVVLLAGAFLGPRNGFLSQLSYLAMGVLGAPVFAGGASGPATLFGPSGGYLLAFPPAAALVGALAARRHSLPAVALSMSAGLVLIFAAGALYLSAVWTHSIAAAITEGVVLFSWWDLLKLAAAAMIYYETGKRWKRLPARL